MEKDIKKDLVKINLQPSDTENLNFEKILKSNSIIFGKMPDNENTILYAYDFKNLNFLYRLLQELIKTDKNPPAGAVTIRFPLKLFSLVVDNQEKWKRYFIKSITRLNNTQFLLKNYYNEENQKVHFQITQLLAFPKFYSEKAGNMQQIQSVVDYNSKTKKETINQKDVDFLEVTFPKEIAMSLWQQRGFGYTHIDFKTINSFSNKHAINFYEALLSKIQLSINDLDSVKYIKLTQDDISGIFKKNIDTSINLKNYLDKTIDFKNNIFPELKKILPLSDYSVEQKDFSMTFGLDDNKLDNFRANKLTPYQIEMEKFQRLITSEAFQNEYLNAYADASSSLYVVSGDGISEALANFLSIIHEKYYDIELLTNDKDKAKFGNVIMVRKVGFCNKDYNNKPLNKKTSNKFLEYLYKNYYNEIMQNIYYKNAEQSSVAQKAEINSILIPFIGEKIILSENEAGIIKNVEQTNDGKIEVMFDVFNRDDREMDIISMALKKFDDIVALTTYVVENKKL